MAERLTEKDKYGNNAIFQKKDKFTIAKDKNNDIRVYGKAIDKLAQLEDIMEKYGIESVEELGCLIEQTPKFIVKENIEKYGQEINGVFFSNEQMLILSQYNELQEPYKKRYEQIKIDRDTWKRACELACETLKQVMGKPLWIGGNIPTPEVKDSEYFYQQAKKDGNDE